MYALCLLQKEALEGTVFKVMLKIVALVVLVHLVKLLSAFCFYNSSVFVIGMDLTISSDSHMFSPRFSFISLVTIISLVQKFKELLLIEHK